MNRQDSLLLIDVIKGLCIDPKLSIEKILFSLYSSSSSFKEISPCMYPVDFIKSIEYVYTFIKTNYFSDPISFNVRDVMKLMYTLGLGLYNYIDLYTDTCISKVCISMVISTFREFDNEEAPTIIINEQATSQLLKIPIEIILQNKIFFIGCNNCEVIQH